MGPMIGNTRLSSGALRQPLGNYLPAHGCFGDFRQTEGGLGRLRKDPV